MIFEVNEMFRKFYLAVLSAVILILSYLNFFVLADL